MRAKNDLQLIQQFAALSRACPGAGAFAGLIPGAFDERVAPNLSA
jgi:hypothetical protein